MGLMYKETITTQDGKKFMYEIAPTKLYIEIMRFKLTFKTMSKLMKATLINSWNNVSNRLFGEEKVIGEVDENKGKGHHGDTKG